MGQGFVRWLLSQIPDLNCFEKYFVWPGWAIDIYRGYMCDYSTNRDKGILIKTYCIKSQIFSGICANDENPAFPCSIIISNSLYVT